MPITSILAAAAVTVPATSGAAAPGVTAPFYREFAIAFGFFVVANFIYNLGFLLFALVRGVRVEVFGIFFGPALLRFYIGDILFRVNAFPLGGYVKFTGRWPAQDGMVHRGRGTRGFEQLSSPERIALMASGPVAGMVLCAALLGPVTACRSLAGCFVAFARGIADPARAHADVMQYFQLIRDHHFAHAAGVLTATLLMINLLPLPAVTGGAILMELATWLTGRRIGSPPNAIVQPLGFLFVVVMFVWAAVMLTAVTGRPWRPR